ncbi:MAG: hypothetical protein JSW50_00640 [Candidatus Latescibacterota bacterium]|nr:MAG: hypothetical protein JSW50_00640 [Candidatus Latescibacterota bacterium]
MSQKRRFSRNIHAGAYIDAFLVAAVGTILVIRFYLHVTGYPQIGGGTLHVAHMLWGGLLMAASIGILFSFLSRTATYIAVIIGGIGFGTFIDEVGKFVTRDNDYFFQPAVAIMYGTFVVFYLVGRLVHGRRAFTQTEYLANALDEMQELVIDELDEDENARIQSYLDKSNPNHPLTQPLNRALAEARPHASARPDWFGQFRRWLRRLYRRVADLPGFDKVVIIFFAGQLVVKSMYLFALIFLQDADPVMILDRRVVAHLAAIAQDLTFAETAEIIVGVVAAVFILMGIVTVYKSRLRAYRFFRASILVNIFLTEIFVFAQEEFGALVGFVFNLTVLIILNYLIERETLRLHDKGIYGDGAESKQDAGT